METDKNKGGLDNLQTTNTFNILVQNAMLAY